KLREHGVSISYADLLASFPCSVITRAHFATYLFENKHVRSTKEAFERYIGDHACCFIPREKVVPEQAIELILQAQGIPILAHPLLYHMSTANLKQLLTTLKEAGLVGIEAVYSSHSPSQEREVKALAKEYALKISGGSDFHGLSKPNLDLGTGYGKLFIPFSILQDLRN
ncbi:MAG: PHP domain-containing protein, partial [Eubacteriales bacterium]